MQKILIVDDQPCIREVVSENLIDEGYEVTTAASVDSARSHIQSSPPDLVLLDLYLNGPQGFGLLKDIKRENCNVPVIILTAYDSYSEDPRLSEADGYVLKSFDFGGLKQKVAQVLTSQEPVARREIRSHSKRLEVIYAS
jgi:DNA-binding response OmpR family regulator